jgi:hypothetical protein
MFDITYRGDKLGFRSIKLILICFESFSSKNDFVFRKLIHSNLKLDFGGFHSELIFMLKLIVQLIFYIIKT